MENNDIIVLQTDKYGQSLFAKRDFKKGDLVFEITGKITKCPSIYTIPIGYDIYINPYPTEIAQFLCHSCEPNCGIQNKTNVVAMQNISKGDEITINYAMIVYKYNDEILKQDIKCNCGKPTCSGKFGSYLKLNNELKQKYKGFISDYLLD